MVSVGVSVGVFVLVGVWVTLGVSVLVIVFVGVMVWVAVFVGVLVVLCVGVWVTVGVSPALALGKGVKCLSLMFIITALEVNGNDPDNTWAIILLLSLDIKTREKATLVSESKLSKLVAVFCSKFISSEKS